MLGFEDATVSDLFIPNTRSWDVGFLNEFFYVDDVNRILRTITSPATTEDKLIWHFNKNGVYSVCSAYKLGASLTVDDILEDRVEWELLRKLKIPPKVKILLW